ncbi:hypothetical protein CC1G_13855 [Coprinopsis cinerea okayama7|uniref:Uncharacterized protein n=1 Tax=Coprinopsis cinerea (strain Okayama-7 / 130 / ATCC MYA-4618 / FGSC 9003) TaxID=240176 RepID=D6RKV7_COPC7|nr:hypothetical protein CC1G_13855 [Coprinopsis cinerea okayama7\|eukprot:XP_002911820.1 hypothetical protein CC1G_13855 [Coprinopsis cinerea okayama7\
MRPRFSHHEMEAPSGETSLGDSYKYEGKVGVRMDRGCRGIKRRGSCVVRYSFGYLASRSLRMVNSLLILVGFLLEVHKAGRSRNAWRYVLSGDSYSLASSMAWNAVFLKENTPYTTGPATIVSTYASAPGRTWHVTGCWVGDDG